MRINGVKAPRGLMVTVKSWTGSFCYLEYESNPTSDTIVFDDICQFLDDLAASGITIDCLEKSKQMIHDGIRPCIRLFIGDVCNDVNITACACTGKGK